MTMTVQSAKAIAGEIAGLQELKPEVPEFTAFGDSNWDAIDAQIAVLKGDLSEDDIEGAWYENEHVYENALTARQWLNDELEGGGLVDDWQTLRGVKVLPADSPGFLL